MILLALDLATVTGVAVGAIDGCPAFSTHTLPKTGTNVGRFLKAHELWLADTMRAERVGFVAFEAPIMGGRAANLVTVRKLHGLAGVTEMVCEETDTRCFEANLMRLKVFWAGSGRATKDDMVDAARRRGFAVHRHDEADALAVWVYTVAKLDALNGTDFARRWDLAMGAAA